MEANSFGVRWLKIDTPFKCDIHYQRPRGDLGTDRFKVLYLFNEPEGLRMPEAALAEHAASFDVILTHDERHLRYPNAVLTAFWCPFVHRKPSSKRFEVSSIISNGDGRHPFDGYARRLELFHQRDLIRPPKRLYMSNRLPDWQSANLPPLVNDKRDCLFESMFNIAIENRIEDNYFTEKLLDNFLTYTVPIYRGCMNLRAHGLDERGIIRFESMEECIEICNTLTPEDYYSRLGAMHSNAGVTASHPDHQITARKLIIEAHDKKIRGGRG